MKDRRRKCVLGFSVFVILLIFIIFSKDSSFQNHNTFNLIKVFTEIAVWKDYVDISSDKQRSNGEEIYVTKKDNKEELFDYLERTYDQKFIRQMGAGYLFDGPTIILTVESETFLRYYTIWEVKHKEMK